LIVAPIPMNAPRSLGFTMYSFAPSRRVSSTSSGELDEVKMTTGTESKSRIARKVEEDQIRQLSVPDVLHQDLDRVPPVGGDMQAARDLVLLERFLDQIHVRRVVLDHEDAGRLRSRGHSTPSAAGSVRRNVDPPPGFDSTQIRPP